MTRVEQLTLFAGENTQTNIPVAVSGGKAWQRIIREQKQAKEVIAPAISNISDAECRKISYAEASKIILNYEWLGTMGQGSHCYGIYYEGVVAGAVCFGLPASLTAGDMFGKHHRDKAICLERGACAWWAHPHSASKLIMYAVNDMTKTTKYRIFFAYSDEDAGEVGTVYQACNWIYLGRMASGGSQNKLVTPDGVMKDSRHIMKYATKYQSGVKNRTEAREVLHRNGWESKKTKPKCKYVMVRGNKREIKSIMSDFNMRSLPYPKRRQND